MIGLDARVVRRVHAGLTIDVAISLGLEPGILFGPSGAGKTSVLRSIAGLDRPRAGFVRVNGESLFDSDAGIRVRLRSRRIGVIFQDDLLFPHLKARDNIEFGLKGWPRSSRKARLAEIAELCGVGSLLDRRPGALSGGERQRVGLARALAPRPRLLLCDEPVSAIDLENRFALIDRLRDVQVAESIPVLYVTHSPAEAIRVGSRLFLIEQGRIVAEGRPLEVLATIQERSLSHLEGLRNVFRSKIDSHDPQRGETRLQLEDGPVLVVPLDNRAIGSAVSVVVRADEILLASRPIAGLSARNQVEGIVDRLVGQGSDVEVIVRTGGLLWIVSVTASAVADLGLKSGLAVTLIIKARSCLLR